MSAHSTIAHLQQGMFPASFKGLHKGVAGEAAMLGWGLTAELPSAVAGWAKGAIWIDHEAGVVYVNDGTVDSCVFEAIGGGTLTADTISESTSGSGVTVDGVLLKDNGITLGGSAHDGLLAGAGKSATPYTMTGASKSAISLYVTSASTADSNRAIYSRITLSGAAGGGEAVRAFATGTGTGLTALRGAHISASISGSGTITGEMQAIKGTLHVPNSTLGGTSAALGANLYADGSSSAGSNLAYIRTVLDGTAATGLAGVPLLAIDGITVGNAGTGNTVDAISGDKAVTHLAKITINGAAYYIMLRNAV